VTSCYGFAGRVEDSRTITYRFGLSAYNSWIIDNPPRTSMEFSGRMDLARPRSSPDRLLITLLHRATAFFRRINAEPGVPDFPIRKSRQFGISKRDEQIRDVRLICPSRLIAPVSMRYPQSESATCIECVCSTRLGWPFRAQSDS